MIIPIGLHLSSWADNLLRKHIHFEPLAAQGKGCTVGCDYAGTVVQVGPKVTKDFKVGNRIAGFTHGVNSVEKEDGCFAEYAVAKGDVQCKLPDNISDEEASTLGVGVWVEESIRATAGADVESPVAGPLAYGALLNIVAFLLMTWVSVAKPWGTTPWAADRRRAGRRGARAATATA